MPCIPVLGPWFVSSSIKGSRTNSSPSKRISIRISICVRLRIVEIIEPEMSPISGHSAPVVATWWDASTSTVIYQNCTLVACHALAYANGASFYFLISPFSQYCLTNALLFDRKMSGWSFAVISFKNGLILRVGLFLIPCCCTPVWKRIHFGFSGLSCGKKKVGFLLQFKLRKTCIPRHFD